MTDYQRSDLAAGWYAILEGDPYDKGDWLLQFAAPFDPVVLVEPDGSYLIFSTEFQGQTDVYAAKEKARALVARLNGAMQLDRSTGSLAVGSMFQVLPDGKRHHYLEAESVSIRMRMSSPTITVYDAAGNLVIPDPQPSVAQHWNTVANGDHRVADLLEQLGRASDWYEIYKTIEFAEHLVGSKHKLERVMGTSRAEMKNMRETANFYRHARAHKPDTLTQLNDAKQLLKGLVQAALNHVHRVASGET